MENANTLGAVSAVLAVILICHAWRKRLRGLLFILSLGVIVQTGSRGAMLLVLVFICLLALAGHWRWGRGALVMALLLAGVISLVWGEQLLNTMIFRTGNSRATGWELAGAIAADNPWLGVGIEDAQLLPIAGSWTAAVAAGGYVGLMSLVLGAIAFVARSKHLGRMTLCFAGTIMIYGAVESWLLSLVGPIAILFAITWVALATYDAPRDNSDTQALRVRREGSRHIRRVY